MPKRATIQQIRDQYRVVREAMNELYGPLAQLEEECLTLDDMLGIRVEGAEYEEDPPEEPRRRGG
jgi:hypothetical protein